MLSPYVWVDLDDNVKLSRAEVARCAPDPRFRVWGDGDGAACPIRTTCSRYFADFVWNRDFRKADEILYNDMRQRGMTPDNNHEIAGPDGIVVELHFRESGGDLRSWKPWQSLRLVLRRTSQGQLRLIAITQDEWTI